MYSRRDVLWLAASLGLIPFVPGLIGCGDDGEGVTGGDGLPVYEYTGPLGPPNLFQHGVASGDPLTDAVILWTRVTPETPVSFLDVFFEVAEDADFTRRVNAGWAVASAQVDYTVKIDAARLRPGMTYYYRFFCLGRSSAVGRTRTAPQGTVNHLRFAVVSCSGYSFGYFHAYERIAARTDLSAVLHLGDYIYEYGNDVGGVRPHEPPREILSLQDYRQRYSQYRRDPKLQAVHQQHPFITVWDDHESANNAWRDGAENHTEGIEGAWAERKRVAQQVYSEWMPIRVTDQSRIFRAFRFGDLADLLMLDTRLWGRDQQASHPGSPDIFNENRTILGADQEAWLGEQLRNSNARWRLVGQQVLMAQLKSIGLPNSQGGGSYLNEDQWDGYQASRQRFFEMLRNGGIGNVVVLTGDIHASGAADLTEDPNNPEAYDPATGYGSVGVEFVCPGVTSPGLPGGNIILPGILFENPHIKWADLERRGYFVLDVTPERVQADWFLLNTVLTEDYVEEFAAGFAVVDGANHLVQQFAPAV